MKKIKENIKPSTKPTKMGNKVSGEFKKQNIKGLKITENNMENTTFKIGDIVAWNGNKENLSSKQLYMVQAKPINKIIDIKDNNVIFETGYTLPMSVLRIANEQEMLKYQYEEQVKRSINPAKYDLQETSTSASSGQYSSKYFVDAKNGKGRKPLYKGGVIIEPNPNTHDAGVNSFKVVKGKLNESEMKQVSELLVKNLDKLIGDGRKFKIKTKDGRVAVVSYLGQSVKDKTLNPRPKHMFKSLSPDAEGYDDVFQYDDKDVQSKVHLYTTPNDKVTEENISNKRRVVKVTYDNGKTITTEINGSDDEIKDYFQIGKEFNIGKGERDCVVKVKGVEIIDETTTSASSGAYTGKLMAKKGKSKPTYPGGQLVSLMEFNTDNSLIGQYVLYNTERNKEVKKAKINKIGKSFMNKERHYLNLDNGDKIIMSMEDVNDLQNDGKVISQYLSSSNPVRMKVLPMLKFGGNLKESIEKIAKEFNISNSKVESLINESIVNNNINVEDTFFNELPIVKESKDAKKDEEVYIEFLNKDKNFKQDKKVFKSYEEAVKWAKKNLEKFNPDMIKYSSLNEDNTLKLKSYVIETINNIKDVMIKNGINESIANDRITESYINSEEEISKIIEESFTKKIKTTYLAKKIYNEYVII